jgi:hypothetical protein
MASGIVAGIAGDGGDPRLSVSNARIQTLIKPQERGLHDVHVPFEEYVYYAAKSRAEEDANADAAPKTTLKDVIFPTSGAEKRQFEVSAVDSEKRRGSLTTTTTHTNANLSRAEVRAAVSDEEWTNASRALRTASAAACFYLITTDILGPFGIGFAIGTMGWGEGIGLFTLFGACAGL